MHSRKVIALAVAGVTALAAGGSASSAMAAGDSSGTLVGAGSTLVAPLMAKWTQQMSNRYSIGVTYGAVGSGAGIAQISARTVDFGASDAPLTSAQASSCKGCVQIPWALTATGIAYNIKGVSKLKLTGDVLAAIYQGQITRWNDRRIRAINHGVRLPNLKITPAFRSDGSGDTYAFTDYLSRVSRSWKRSIGTSTQVSFPTGVGGKGNDGITAVVSSTNGSIGYISASYIIAHGLKAAALRNAAGRFEYPNLRNIQAAAKVVKHVPANNSLHIVNPPKKAKTAYPLSTFTYAIVPRDTSKKSLIKQLVLYAVNNGQEFGPALDFAPLPGIVIRAARNTVNSL